MKLDLSKIEGYDEMTPEEKVKALESFEIADPDYSGYVKKDVFDKTAHDLAEKKKQLRAKQSEEETREQERNEELATLQENYNKLLRENQVSKFTSELLSVGYDDKLAESTANAMVDGDSKTIFANQKKFLESATKKMRVEILKDTPKPTGNGGSETMTIDKFRKMSASERYEYAQANPEEYKALYQGGND